MLETCCGGFRLNTAGVTIGWLGVIGSVIGIAISAVVLNRLDDVAKYLADLNNNEEVVRGVILIVACIYLVLSAINLISSTLLIVGTVKERHLLLIPWLIESGFALFSCCIYLIRLIAIAISGEIPIDSLGPMLIVSGLELVLHCYLWYVIYSLYKQIQARRDSHQRLIETPANFHSYTKI